MTTHRRMEANGRMDRKTAFAVWRSIMRSIGATAHNGRYSWDWPTLRITYPQRAAMLKRCKQVLDTTTLG